MAAVEELQQITTETADALSWIKTWKQQLEAEPITHRNPVGQTEMEKILTSVRNQLDEIQATATRIEEIVVQLRDDVQSLMQRVTSADRKGSAA